jgi:MYXO-CTERM domain-containing protein
VEGLAEIYCAQLCHAANPVCPPLYECAVDIGACFKSETCGPNGECAQGQVCVDDGERYCTTYCDDDGSCPTGYACAEDTNVCFKSKAPPGSSTLDNVGNNSGGCAVRAGAASESVVGWLVALSLALAVRRRRSLT